MTESQVKRARSPKAKQARRDALLEGAASLLTEGEFSTIRMEDVARAAGVSKGTLYLYFSKREEVFLTLALEGLVSWLGDVEAALRADLSIRGAAEVATVFVNGFLSNSQLIRLLPLIPALQVVATSDGPVEAHAALELRWRRLEDVVSERLYVSAGGDHASPVALAVALLLGVCQVAAVGVSLHGSVSLHGYAGDRGLPHRQELERFLTALFLGVVGPGTAGRAP